MGELITEQQVEDDEQLNFDLLVLEIQQLKQQLEAMTKQSKIFLEQRDIERKSKEEYRQQLEEAIEVIDSLSKRHQWHPEMGECVCLPHRQAYEFLSKYRGRNDSR